MNDEGTASGNVIEKPLVGGSKFRTKLVGTDTDDDGVVMRKISKFESGGVQHFDLDVETTEGVGNGFSSAEM